MEAEICPWCQKNTEVTHTTVNGGQSRFFVECKNLRCMATGPNCETVRAAIMRWNYVASIFNGKD